MELFDFQEYAIARQREALRSFRFAERAGLTREPSRSGTAHAKPGSPPKQTRGAREWSAGAE